MKYSTKSGMGEGGMVCCGVWMGCVSVCECLELTLPDLSNLSNLSIKQVTKVMRM